MELDDLKSVWKKYNETQLDAQQVDEQAIKQMLKGKTQNVVAKISQNIVLETAMLVVCTLGSVILFTLSIDVWLWYANAVYLGLCGLSFVFYSFLYQKIQKFKFNPQNIKSELNVLLIILHNYISLYFTVSLVLIPPSMLYGFFYGYLRKGASLQDLFSNITLLIVVVIGLSLIFMAGYFFLKWYIKMLYGNYMLKLKDFLDELKEST